MLSNSASGRKKNLMPLSAVILFTLVLSVIIFRDFLFGGYFFFTKGTLSDLLRANLPTYYGIYDAFKSGSIWSWSMGIGDTIFTHADVLGDPFTYIIFLFGRARIPDMFVWHILVKLIFEGIAAYLYLNYFKLNKAACIYGSVLYVFSGFSMIAGSNFALGTVCVYFPLILLGIEKFLESGKKGLLVTFLVLTAVYSYYFFYISGILAAIYMVARLIMRGENFKNIVIKLLKLLGFGVLSVAAAAFIMFPQLSIVLNSSRAGSGTDTVFSLGLFKFSFGNFLTIFSRSFNLNLLGDRSGTEYCGAYYDYFQLSSVFVTSASFVLYGQYFAFSNKQNRKRFIIISGLTAVLLCVPFFAFFTNAFLTVNFRWEYIVSLLSALGCALGLDAVIKNKRFNRKYLYTTMIASLVFLGVSVRYFYMSNEVKFAKYAALPMVSVFAVFAALVIIDLLLGSADRAAASKARRASVCTAAAVITAAVTMFEIAYNYNPMYHKDTVRYGYKKDDTVYFDDSYEIIKELKSSDSGFYRIYKDFDSVTDKNDIASCNDAMAQNYYGVKNYSSVNNSNYINFLSANGAGLGITNYRLLQNFHLVYCGDGNYKIYDGKGNVWAPSKPVKGKYTVSLKKDSSSDSVLWRLEKQKDGSYYIKSALNGMYISVKDENLILRRNKPEKFKLEYRFKSYVALSKEDDGADVLTEGYYSVTPKKHKNLCLTSDITDKKVTLENKVDLFDYAKGQMLNYINDIGDNIDLLSYLGVKYYMTENKNARLPENFELLFEKHGIYVYKNNSCYPLAFSSSAVTSAESFEKLSADEKNEALLNSTVADSVTDSTLPKNTDTENLREAFSFTGLNGDKITAKIAVPSDSEYLNFTVPYSENWKVYINGKSVHTEKINIGLLGVKTDGEMKNKTVDVEIEYIPRDFYAGIAVSAVTAVLCAAYFVIKKIRRTKIGA